ncbi:RsmB/NOP family class I SAM-dependent RNA methyltransferase [Xinfangfangia sp. D13-10-4-6]|uniref:RsmB/NOP family class I SAM-dependent RNA methyltransferase n=1 Tax=Pseudogemmobacter hezensis TaxID=2737662 RepID=UPI001555EB63|nr:RsmB/NOP family class I SAM-dependent RNA methyltransferase [Pseudogemmobacter hezensis]NPD15615.1 RsmB/NOP family class I SAM-dependent RNA methyltransferase [Pseudogemmobacter hezensis]
MRSPGRASAAILVLDRILGGEAAEKALSDWGRASRYAGSKDRAAVRDLVFDALRQRRTAQALGGGAAGGRALVLGILRARGEDLAGWFDGSDHAPAPPQADEAPKQPLGAAQHDIPDWLEAPLQAALGADFAPVMQEMRHRAPVILRVNSARISREAAIAALNTEGITAEPHPLAATALHVTAGARTIAGSAAFNDGLVELQDAASQAVVADLGLAAGMRVLDLCAGGGGKTLAMAAQARLQLWAYDVSARRMADLPARAERAGVPIQLTADPEAHAPYDLVLTDVPCSGSGSWRRDPEGKWALTPERLQELTVLQQQITDRAAAMVAPGGCLAYATCSFLKEENEDQVNAFLQRHPGWQLASSRRFSPLDGGDGFFTARLLRSQS